MLSYPQIDPVIVALGPVKIHWYGMMYLLGFAAVWLLGKERAKRPYSPISPEALEDLVYFGALGVILGGRIGYILFYHFGLFLENPLVLFKIWQGGMSFHGGMLGVFVAMHFFGKKHHCSMLQLTDIIAPLCPIGLGLGRLGILLMNYGAEPLMLRGEWFFQQAGRCRVIPRSFMRQAWKGFYCLLFCGFTRKNNAPLPRRQVWCCLCTVVSVSLWNFIGCLMRIWAI